MSLGGLFFSEKKCRRRGEVGGLGGVEQREAVEGRKYMREEKIKKQNNYKKRNTPQ